MIEPGTIFDFRLTLTNSFPEIWRRVLVPEECTLSDLHYVISFSFGWFDDSTHEFTQGSRAFGPKSSQAPDEREDETKVFLLDLFRRPGHDIRYVYERHDRWQVEVVLDGMQAPVPRGNYPCCIEGNNDGPPDGVGGVTRYNQLVGLIEDPAARRALAPGCEAVGCSDFEPTYFDIGDLNGALGLIFPPDGEAFPFAPATTSGHER
ncbi:MAG: plasmid pRiA4b ORF-3 family protein [Polyangiales bacterium]|jgi:hypothetical protein